MDGYRRPLSLPPLRRARAALATRLKRFFAEEPPAIALARGLPPPSIAELQQFASRHRLSSLLPYEFYDPEERLYFNGDSAGFLLEITPAVGLNIKRLKVLGGLLSQGLKSETNIQITLWADPDIHPLLARWRNERPQTPGDFYGELADQRIDYLRGGNWKSLFDAQPFLLRNWRLFLSLTRPVDPRDPDLGELDYLVKTRAAFRGLLDSAEMPNRDVPPDDFIGLMDVILNPHPGPRPRWHWDENRVLAEQMVDRDALLLVGRDALGLAHRDYAVSVYPFSVRQWPLQWAGWAGGELLGAMMDNVQRLPCPVLYTQTIHVTDQVSAMGSAKLKAARATQMNDSPLGRYVPAWKDRKRDWDYTVANMEDGHKLMKSHWQIVAFAPQGQEDFCVQRLRAVFSGRGWQITQDRFAAIAAFRAALPLMAGPVFVDELKRFGMLQSQLTWNSVNVSPWIGEWKGTGSPLLLLSGRRGQIQFVDFFDNKAGNYNVAVSATSGAGKSFFTQELVIATRATGGRVNIIDAGKSYLNICRLLGGEYITFSRLTKPCLNPFTRIVPDEFQEEELPLLKQLHGQMASPEQPLDPLQLAFMEQALVKAWQKYGNEAEPTAVAAELAVLGQSEPVARDLATMLYPYTRPGSYGRFFSGRANVDLSNPLSVLELDDLVNTPDLQSVVLLTLMLHITEGMYHADRKLRKLAIIDEAWQLMGQGQAGKFIERGYRTARKYGGAFMTVTQSINDYYRSPISRAALENSDFLCLLRQKEEFLKKARAENQIAMDDGLEELLLSLHKMDGMYSELAIKGPEGISIGRLIVDPFSEKLYSTRPEEFQFIQDCQAQGMSIVQAVEALVRRSQRRTEA